MTNSIDQTKGESSTSTWFEVHIDRLTKLAHRQEELNCRLRTFLNRTSPCPVEMNQDESKPDEPKQGAETSCHILHCNSTCNLLEYLMSETEEYLKELEKIG